MLENLWIRFFIFILISVLDIIIFFNVCKRIRTLTKVSINFEKAKFELASTGGDSLLDKHIDEIYNFFKHNKYKIVVLEDLDRYKNTDIYERLKRINRLINSSKLFCEDNKQVKFLYTIGDHAFDDERYKERTKFFDFVIPLVPVINTRNSYSEINERFSVYPEGKRPSETLLKDISIHIDDMRTLKNIVNEYQTYYNLLIDQDDVYFANKVFAIICFKNRYPNEFSDFQKNIGYTIEIIGNLEKYKIQDTKTIDVQIELLENEILNSPKELANAVEQVNDIFKMYLYRKCNNNGLMAKKNGKNHLNLSNKDQILSASNNLSRLFEADTIHLANVQYDVKKIETMEGISEPYSKRIRYVELKNKEKLADVKKELEALRKRRQTSMYLNWSEVLKRNIDTEEARTFNQKFPLIFYFLYHGYIEKDYTRYFGFFKEGHMTNNDKTYISALKISQQIKRDFEIDNPKEIIKELVSDDLRSSGILNYHLIRELALNKDEKLIVIIELRKENIKQLVDFLNGYLTWYYVSDYKDETPKIIIQELYLRVNDFWKYIFDNEDIIEKNVCSLPAYSLASILTFKDFLNLDSPNDVYIKRYIENSKQIMDVLEYISDGVLIDAMRRFAELETFLISDLSNIKFTEGETNLIFEYLYENSLYDLNNININVILNRKKDELDNEYSNNVTDAILNIEALASLKNYIEKNKEIFLNECINEYILNQYLKSDSLIYLLETICEKLDDKEKLISKMNYDVKIEDLSQVSTDIYQLLVDEGHVTANFSNIKIYIDEIGYDEQVEKFIISNIEEFKRSEYVLDDGYSMLISIIKLTRNNVIIKLLNEIMKDFEIEISIFNSIPEQLNMLLGYDFNLILDDKAIPLLNDNVELLYNYLHKYFTLDICMKNGLIINPQVACDLYQNNAITSKQLYDLVSMKIVESDKQKDYFNTIAILLNKEKFIELLGVIEKNNEALEMLLNHILEKGYTREFIIKCLVIIDNEYSSFDEKQHFVIEYKPELESILKEIEGEVTSKYTIQDNGNIHVYMKKE